jgi:hypothetical protein
MDLQLNTEGQQLLLVSISRHLSLISRSNGSPIGSPDAATGAPQDPLGPTGPVPLRPVQDQTRGTLLIAGLKTQDKKPATGPGHLGIGRVRDYFRARVRGGRAPTVDAFNAEHRIVGSDIPLTSIFREESDVLSCSL